MKILHLTPGTGNFHCGSCHRDNHLVKALRKLGHDVTMLPLYLPLVTDTEPESGDAPIFAGGVNMYLQQKFRLFRKTPRWLDKIFDAVRLLRFAGKRASMTSPKDLGEMTVESLRGTNGLQVKEWRRLLEWIATESMPEVVSLSNGLLNGLAEPIQRDLKAKVVCSLQGEDTFLDTLPEPWRAQSWDLFRKNSQWVDVYVATSDWYTGEMRRRLELGPDKLVRVHNGLDLSTYSPALQKPERPTIGYLARMIKGKGIDQLVDAFLLLRHRNTVPGVRLHLGGTKTDADEPFLKILRKRIDDAGATEDVSWHPNLTLEEKIQFFQGLTILSVPATYGEAFGLYVLEALACGVPVVEPEHAGLAEVVRETGGGILVRPDDPTALADGLQELLVNKEKAESLAAAGRETALRKFSAEAMAGEFAKVCSQALR